MGKFNALYKIVSLLIFSYCFYITSAQTSIKKEINEKGLSDFYFNSISQLSAKLRKFVDSGILNAYELDSLQRPMTKSEVQTRSLLYYFKRIRTKLNQDELPHDSLFIETKDFPTDGFIPNFAFILDASNLECRAADQIEYIAPLIDVEFIAKRPDPLYWVSWKEICALNVFSIDETNFIEHYLSWKLADNNNVDDWSKDPINYWLLNNKRIVGRDEAAPIDIGKYIRIALSQKIVSDIINNKVLLIDSTGNAIKNNQFLAFHKKVTIAPLLTDPHETAAQNDTFLYSNPQDIDKIWVQKRNNNEIYIKIGMLTTGVLTTKVWKYYYLNYDSIKQSLHPELVYMLNFLLMDN